MRTDRCCCWAAQSQATCSHHVVTHASVRASGPLLIIKTQTSLTTAMYLDNVTCLLCRSSCCVLHGAGARVGCADSQEHKTAAAGLAALAWSVNFVVPFADDFLAIRALFAVSPIRSIMPPTVEARAGARSNSLNLRLLLPAFSTSTLPNPCNVMMPDSKSKS